MPFSPGIDSVRVYEDPHSSEMLGSGWFLMAGAQLGETGLPH